jgi:hypothetical protein
MSRGQAIQPRSTRAVRVLGLRPVLHRLIRTLVALFCEEVP